MILIDITIPQRVNTRIAPKRGFSTAVAIQLYDCHPERATQERVEGLTDTVALSFERRRSRETYLIERS